MPSTEVIICECGCGTEITTGIFLTGAYNTFSFESESRVNLSVATPGDRFFLDASHLETWANALLNPG